MENHTPDPLQWLNNEDEVCRDGRLSRLKWLVERTPEGRWIFEWGGLMSKYLFEEARYCFVYGQYLATVLLGIAYIERTLASLFYAEGYNKARRLGLRNLLKMAKERVWIGDGLFNAINNSRIIRNALAHFHTPTDSTTIEMRAFAAESHYYEVLESDARNIIEAMLLIRERLLPSGKNNNQ